MTDTLSSTPERPWYSALASRDTWLRGFVYALFIFSIFTMAGMELAVIMLHLLVLYHRLRTPVSEWLPKWVAAPFLLLPAMGVFSALINPNFLETMVTMKGEYRLLLPFIMLPALALVKLERLMKVYLVFVAAIGVISLFQFNFAWHPLHPGLRGNIANGGFGMNLTLGGVMVMTAPVLVSLAWSARGRQRWMWAGVAGLASVTTVLSMSRSAWIGLAVAFLVLTLRLPRRIAFPLIGVVLALFVTMATLVATGWLKERFEGRFESVLVRRLVETSLATQKERPLLWRAALRGVADAPFFGHGFSLEAYDLYRDKLAKEEGFTGFTYPHLRPHNQFLRVAFAMGVPGLAVFLWMFGAVMVWNGIWLYRASGLFPFEAGLLWGINAALAGSLASSFTLGQFFDSEVQTNILMWMGLAFSVGIGLRRRLNEGILVAD